MNAGVPMIVVVVVNPAGAEIADPLITLEMPKSSTFTSPESVAPLREEQVPRLQIAMNDPERVRRGNRVARLKHVVDGRLDRQRAFFFEHGVEVAPVEILHDDIRRPRLELPRVEHPNDVIAPNLDRRLRLADESRDGIGLRRHVRREEFHRDPLVELQVHRRDDDPHPADAEHALDAVLPGEQLARLG